jgi:hypothetical protein
VRVEQDKESRELAEALRRAREQPTARAREIARERVIRNHARKGVVELGAFMGLFGIPFVLVAVEAAGWLPRALTVQPMATIGSITAVFGGVYAWIHGAKAFFRARDRLEARRGQHPVRPTGVTAVPEPRRTQARTDAVARNADAARPDATARGADAARTAADENTGVRALRAAPDDPRGVTAAGAARPDGDDRAGTRAPARRPGPKVDLRKRSPRRGR